MKGSQDATERGALSKDVNRRHWDGGPDGVTSPGGRDGNGIDAQLRPGARTRDRKAARRESHSAPPRPSKDTVTVCRVPRPAPSADVPLVGHARRDLEHGCWTTCITTAIAIRGVRIPAEKMAFNQGLGF